MGRKKRRFIEKDKEIKFNLVHRSQKDPLYLDEQAGEHVLLPVMDTKQANDLAERLSCLSFSGKSSLSNDELHKKIEEQHKYGIYFDDNYDYLQHLREAKHEIRVEPEIPNLAELLDTKASIVREEPRLRLPSSVFASEFEEDVGYMNQAAPDSDPKINWDPEIVEILDEESNFDFESGENQLDDDFFVKANAEQLDDVEEGNEDESDEESDDEDTLEQEDDDHDSIQGYNNEHNHEYNDFEEDQSLRDFDKKSRFTDYSVTSSVLRRNANLKTLDDRFESFYADYDDEKIGSLDTEEVEGYLNPNSELFMNAIEHFEKKTKKIYYEAEALHKINEETNEDEEDDYDESEEEMEPVTIYERPERPFDCESCRSNSTTKNRPILISINKPKTIEINEKTGLPLGILKDKSMSKKQMDKMDHKITRVLMPIPERKADETKEEKKARKHAVKEARRERRVEKKINKLQFKEEKNAQLKQLENIKSNTITIKLS